MTVENCPADEEAGLAEMEADPPLPYEPQGPWSPPGLARPWPPEEYLRDGGDRRRPADGRSELSGVEPEDAVAHCETADGRKLVVPSNEVRLYSPRFGAVRQVLSLAANEERSRAGGVHKREGLDAPTRLQIVAAAKQHVQLGDQSAARPPLAFYTRQGDGVLSEALPVRAFQDRFKPYENLALIRYGIYEQEEALLLARASEAALAWTHNAAVQVILDATGALAEVKYDASLAVYTVCTPPGIPRLRLVKTASTSAAASGEEVDFTFRFDNIGEETLVRVVIIDNLCSRLEYVPDSAQCSLEARFSTAANEDDSLSIRCELVEPLKPGEGGILRFRCRVR